VVDFGTIRDLQGSFGSPAAVPASGIKYEKLFLSPPLRRIIRNSKDLEGVI
jgi:hypothetical protein